MQDFDLDRAQAVNTLKRNNGMLFENKMNCSNMTL